MLGSILSSPRSALSAEQALDLANAYLKNARNTQDIHLASIFCDDAEISLSQAKQVFKKALSPETLADQTLRNNIGTAYFERGKILDQLGRHDRAQASYKKAEKWGYEEIKYSSTIPGTLLSARGAPAMAQTLTSTSKPFQPSSAQEKSELVDYLFEKALLTLSSLDVPNKPTLFLVYAHDNPAHGKAEASTSKYLIDKLSNIRGVNLYSDQTPMGQAYSSSAEDLKEDGKLEDILTNQLCLLPNQLIKDVGPVDKVVVCCSEVLGNYLKDWSDYKKFYEALRDAYGEDRKAYLKDSEQKSTLAIRQVVRKFSQEKKYKAGFHHVLTEIAFLQIRAEHWKDQHGIIPVSLTPNSYEPCLAHFIPATTVRMEDIPRFEEQAQAGREVYTNQSRHGVLFKVIERLLVDSDEANTFLSKFWHGHSNFISRLKSDLTLGKLEFAKLLDGIFDDIRTALHSQLASTVQQQHHQLRVLNADPCVALKEQYFAALKQDEAFRETLQLYVEPRGKASRQDTGTFNVLLKTQEFLKAKQVILLMGDSGAGKTTFNRVLEKQLWDKKKEDDAIPLFISLPSIEKPEQDLISKALKKRGLSEFQIQKLKKEKQSFVFILDGYDEIQQTQNLYLSNDINQSSGWQGRMVISCRSEYLDQGYRSRFQPNRDSQGENASFQEVMIEPFSKEKIQEYIKQYVTVSRPLWQVKDYLKALKDIPYLQDLVTNPFLLTLSLEVLPRMVDAGQMFSTVRITRVALYDQFVEQWLERGKKRLGEKKLTELEKKAFENLTDEGFTQNGIVFLKNLSVAIYQEQAGNPVVEYSHFRDKGTWKEEFFSREDDKHLLREASPLTRSGNQYQFIHRSLLEYGMARAIFEPQDGERARKAALTQTLARRGSVSSDWSFDSQTTLEIPAVAIDKPLLDSPLWKKSFVNKPSILQFLAERVEQEPLFKEQLRAVIERSKTDKEARKAAANAITILVRADVQFNGEDLQGIQIPGADLSHGVFDSAQLQGADLRKANLHKIWMRQANLSGAQMAGVQLGEWPFLKEDSRVKTCMYSPNGKAFIVVLENHTISVYSTSDWEKIHTLSGHTSFIKGVVYSPNSQQIAASGDDEAVRLWDVQTGHLSHTLSGHTNEVQSVVYSPNGEQIAFSSYDDTVRLWDTQSGQLSHILSGHAEEVLSVVYSPNGEQIASGSLDNTVRLWDAHSGQHRHTLSGHIAPVESVVYSPDGQQIASGSWDNTVRLWDAQTGQLSHTLSGHTNEVRSVMYSPNGQQIASGSFDNTVRLWDPRSGQHRHTLRGHIAPIARLVYSPNGQQIASSGEDYAVWLWDAQSGQLSHTLNGHSAPVKSVAYSPNGQQIASGSLDTTVRLWDAQSGQPSYTSNRHTAPIVNVACSPDGAQIASCSEDKTVRLWDAHSGQLSHTLNGHAKEVKSVVYSPNGQQIASFSSDKTVRLWDARSGTLSAHITKVENVMYSPNGQQIASSGTYAMWLWDAQSGHLNHILRGPTNFIKSPVYSPDGAQIASCSEDKTVLLWDAHSGQLSHTLSGHTKAVRSMVYSPNGQQIASGSFDNTVRLWDAQSGQLSHTLNGHVAPVESIIYSPNGEQIASGSHDTTVCLWDAHSGHLSHILSGHTSRIYKVVYSHDGTQIASDSDDNTVRLWDTHSGQLSHTLSGHTDWIKNVGYSPNGEQIASYGGDNTVRLWDVTSGQCRAVIENFRGRVSSVVWKATLGRNYLVTSCEDTSVRLWQVIEEGGQCHVRLQWSSTHGVLTVTDTIIQGVQGLSWVNRQLLKQRMAVGEPSPSLNLRDASKRLISRP